MLVCNVPSQQREGPPGVHHGYKFNSFCLEPVQEDHFSTERSQKQNIHRRRRRKKKTLVETDFEATCD